ncbi:MAG TPA: hypothetical protein VIW70_06535 [Rubrivivax sp.]
MEPKPTRAEALVQRLLLAAALTAALLGGVVALFGDAAQMPWLAATADNQRAMAVCDRVHGTALRHRCTERVVAAVTRASDAGTTMQASAERAVHAVTRR